MNPRQQGYRKQDRDCHAAQSQDFPFSGFAAETSVFVSNSIHSTDIITDILQDQPVVWPSVGPNTNIPVHNAHGFLMRYSIREYYAVESHPNSDAWVVLVPDELIRDYSLESLFKGKAFTVMVVYFQALPVFQCCLIG